MPPVPMTGWRHLYRRYDVKSEGGRNEIFTYLV